MVINPIEEKEIRSALQPDSVCVGWQGPFELLPFARFVRAALVEQFRYAVYVFSRMPVSLVQFFRKEKTK